MSWSVAGCWARALDAASVKSRKRMSAAVSFGMNRFITSQMQMKGSKLGGDVQHRTLNLEPVTLNFDLDSEHIDKFLNRRRALLKRDALLGRQVDLDDLFEAARAELAGHADVEALHAVLAFEVRGARENLLLVF